TSLWAVCQTTAQYILPIIPQIGEISNARPEFLPQTKTAARKPLLQRVEKLDTLRPVRGVPFCLSGASTQSCRPPLRPPPAFRHRPVQRRDPLAGQPSLLIKGEVLAQVASPLDHRHPGAQRVQPDHPVHP